MSKSINEKIDECKQLVVQNLEKTIQKQMVFKYLKQEKIDQYLRNFPILSKDGYFTLDFNDHQKALQYYDRANFKDKILLRPFNIYLNLRLDENEMKKYYFEGLSDDTLRKMFDMVRKVGICKIYTSYPPGKSNVKPTGVISFIRQKQLSQDEFNSLKDELQSIGIKIYPYAPDKGIKCSVILSDFYEGNLDADENLIEENVKKQITQKFQSIVKDKKDIETITPIVKRREVPDPQNKQGVKTITKVRAMVDFKSSDAAIENFELIRKAYIKQKGKALLNFHNSENNSYISLFTMGLKKPENKQDISDKQFQDLLVDAFRKVNKNVVQVNVYPVSFNKTYVGRIYLRDQGSGKEFIASYTQARAHFHNYFKNPNSITFDLNVDDKSKLRLRNLKRKADQFTNDMKNATTLQQRSRKNGPSNTKEMQMGPMLRFPPQGMPGGMGGVGGMQMGPIGGMQMGHPGSMPMGNMPMGPGMGGPAMGGMGPAMGMGSHAKRLPLQQRLARVLGNKEKLLKDAKEGEGGERLAKKQLTDVLKGSLEQINEVRQEQSASLLDNIMKNRSVKEIIDYLEHPNENFNKIK